MSEAFQATQPENPEDDQIDRLVQQVREYWIAEQSAIEVNEGNESSLSQSYRDDARKTFDNLVELTYKDVYTLAYRMTGREHDAEDVTQEAYRRAWGGLSKFKGDAQFTTWMHRIVVNASNTHMGRRKRHEHADYEDIPERSLVVSGGQEESAANRELSQELQRVLGSLPTKLRAVIVLRDIYDLPHAEIAEQLGISETAAKVRLHRARRKLREELYLRSDELYPKQ